MLNLDRTSGAWLPRLAAAAGVWLFALGAAPGCDPYATLKDVPIDCEAEAGYEFELINDFEKTDDVAWWPAGDSTPYQKTEPTIRAIPDGGRCGSKNASVLAASGNNDWGSLFGLNTLSPHNNASTYEGLSFWARAPGNTTKGFMMLLNDPNTAALDGVTSNCIDLGGGENNPNTITVSIDGQSVQTSGGATRPILPNECGNGYTAMMLVTSEWAFYTVPFGRFQQDPKPNRVPNAILTKVGNVPGTGLLTDNLLQLMLRMPKEARTELWIDNLAFYRRAAM
jgi:hypothetical protein